MIIDFVRVYMKFIKGEVRIIEISHMTYWSGSRFQRRHRSHILHLHIIHSQSSKANDLPSIEGRPTYRETLSTPIPSVSISSTLIEVRTYEWLLLSMTVLSSQSLTQHVRSTPSTRFNQEVAYPHSTHVGSTAKRSCVIDKFLGARSATMPAGQLGYEPLSGAEDRKMRTRKQIMRKCSSTLIAQVGSKTSCTSCIRAWLTTVRFHASQP
jgi:hypothetical protein